MSRPALCLAVVLALTPAARAGKDAPWPQLLGPGRNGLSADTGLNLDWADHPPRVLWKVALGSGFSSLAVLDDRLITQAKKGERDHVVCLSTADGKELWSYDAAPSYLDRQRHGAGPRATPTVAGDRVYCLFPMGELVCLKTADGAKVWQTNILEASGTKNRAGEVYYWGLSASPLVEGDLVIVQPGGDKDNSVVAFDRRTGKKVWGVAGDPSAYGSPIVIEAAGRRQIVCPTGKSILGVDPKGELLWRYEFGNPFDATCATPVWADGLLFVSAAYGVGCAALEIAADGDKVVVKEKWRNKDLQNLMATSIVQDGCIWGCHGDLGARFLRCLDLKTGKVKWERRLDRDRWSFVAAEKRLICVGERGGVYLVEADPEKYVARGELKDLLTYKAWAMPALANRRLYLRDEKQLVCVDLARVEEKK
jgi:outer membrane protein assembly factor BamB